MKVFVSEKSGDSWKNDIVVDTVSDWVSINITDNDRKVIGVIHIKGEKILYLGFQRYLIAIAHEEEILDNYGFKLT